MPAASLRVDVDGNSYLLQPSEQAVIGRDPSCRLHLPHPLVSGRHLQLHHDGSGWRATDLGSTNGTWVDGHRVDEVPVGPETRVRLAMQGPEILLRPEVPAPRVVAPVAARPPSAPPAGPPLFPPPPRH